MLYQGFAQERGFTLIEIVIFIMVIGLAVGILIPLTQSVSGSANPVITQQAIALAQAELDQTIAQKRAAGFGPIASGACVVPMPAGFTCARAVCFVPATNLNSCGAATDFKRVDVTITNAVIGNVTAVTLLTDY